MSSPISLGGEDDETVGECFFFLTLKHITYYILRLQQREIKYKYNPSEKKKHEAQAKKEKQRFNAKALINKYTN